MFQYADLGPRADRARSHPADDHHERQHGNRPDDDEGWRRRGVKRVARASPATSMRMLNRGHEYRRKLLARLDPRLAGITAEETTGLQYAMTENPVFEHYRPLFTGARATWLDVVQESGESPDAHGKPAEVDGRRSELLAGRHQRPRDRPHARGHRARDDRVARKLRDDANVLAPATRRIASPSPFRRRPGRAQDR